MKAIKLTYLSVFLAGATFFMNSCSSTQQFAGTYPKNNITGKGPGYGVIENKTQAAPTTVTTAEVQNNKVTEVTQKTVAAVAQPAPSASAKASHVGNKPFLTAFGKANNMLSGWKEKMTNKIINHVMNKYGVSSSEVSAALASATSLRNSSSLESVSRPLAITSLATGCAAVVTYFGAFFFGPAAIVTGALALVGIKRGGDGKKAFAIAGIALGAFGMLLWLLLWIVVFSVLI